MPNPNPGERFQPVPESQLAQIPSAGGTPMIPQQQQQQQQQQGAAHPQTQSALEDPNAERFMVEFWSGIGSKRLLMAAPNKESAILAAYFVAVQHFPSVHTFGVWRKVDPPQEIGECVCFVALANILTFCTEELKGLTGKKLAVPPVPVQTPEAGFEELGKQLKAQGGVIKK